MKNNRTVSFTLAELYETITAKLSTGGTFVFFPKGTSMKPLIKENKTSVTLVAPDGPPKLYDIILYRRSNGGFVLHRIVKINDNGLLDLRGDNQTRIEHAVKPDSIIGVITELTDAESGKTTLVAESFRYKLYVFFRCTLRFGVIGLSLKNVLRAIRDFLFHRKSTQA